MCVLVSFSIWGRPPFEHVSAFVYPWQSVAVEIFCEDNRPYFFSLRTSADLDKLFRRMKSIKPKLQAAFIHKVGGVCDPTAAPRAVVVVVCIVRVAAVQLLRRPPLPC